MVRIFVEGSDDEKFIIKLLNDLRKLEQISITDSFNFGSIINILGGKKKLLDSNHKKYQQVTQLINIDEIKKVLFIFDCDFEKDDINCNGMKKSLDCFRQLKEELRWDIPIDVYIFDKNLDYFLIDTINQKECYEHFDKLVQCLDIEQVKPNKKPIANLYRDLYPYPQFDFKDDKFQPIKDKLIDLFKGIKQ